MPFLLMCFSLGHSPWCLDLITLVMCLSQHSSACKQLSSLILLEIKGTHMDILQYIDSIMTETIVPVCVCVSGQVVK